MWNKYICFFHRNLLQQNLLRVIEVSVVKSIGNMFATPVVLNLPTKYLLTSTFCDTTRAKAYLYLS